MTTNEVNTEIAQCNGLLIPLEREIADIEVTIKGQVTPPANLTDKLMDKKRLAQKMRNYIEALSGNKVTVELLQSFATSFTVAAPMNIEELLEGGIRVERQEGLPAICSIISLTDGTQTIQAKVTGIYYEEADEEFTVHLEEYDESKLSSQDAEDAVVPPEEKTGGGTQDSGVLDLGQ